MVDFGESDKMIKISEKMDKSDIYIEFSDISFFIQTKHPIYIYIYIQYTHTHTHKHIYMHIYTNAKKL